MNPICWQWWNQKCLSIIRLSSSHELSQEEQPFRHYFIHHVCYLYPLIGLEYRGDYRKLSNKQRHSSQRDIEFAFGGHLWVFHIQSFLPRDQLASVTLPVLSYSHMTASLITFNYSMARLPSLPLPALHTQYFIWTSFFSQSSSKWNHMEEHRAVLCETGMEK